jgi:hypothetical protein
MGAIALVLANTAVILAAKSLASRIHNQAGPLGAILFLLIRLLLISAVVLAAGFAGILSARALGALGAVAVAIAVSLGAHRVWPRPRFPDLGALLYVALGLVAARLLLQVWFFSPYSYDAISYHLTKIGEWIQAGRFTSEMGPDTHASFPAGFELIETWWVVFLHHDVLIELAGVEFLALGAVSTYSLARWVGLSTRSAGLAALGWTLTPAIQVHATSCLNDGPVAALVLATAAMLAACAPRAMLLIPVGLGIGIKPTFAYAVPGLLVFWSIVRGSGPPLKNDAPKLAVSLGFLSVLVAASWYLRNLVWFGNPLHPIGTEGLLGPSGLVKIQFGPSLRSAVANLTELVTHRIYDRDYPYGPLLINISGWGPAAFSGGLVGAVTALRDRRSFRWLAAAFGVSLLSVLCLIRDDPWNGRFVLFFPALLSIALAALVQRFALSLVVLVPALLLEFAGTMVTAELPWRDARRLARVGWRERSLAPLYGIAVNADSVAYYVSGPWHKRGESYLLYGPDFSRRVIYLQANSSIQLIGQMRAARTRLLYASSTTAKRDALLETAVREGYLDHQEGRLYALREPLDGPP